MFKNKNPNFSKAFTLVELLTVIAIAMILMSISAVGFYSLRSSREVKVNAEKIRDQISRAHSLSISPDTDVSGLTNVVVSISDGEIKITEESHTYTTPISKRLKITPVSGTNTEMTFIANDPEKLGQLDDDKNYKFTVSKSDGTSKYQLEVNKYNGNVNITAQ